MVDVGFELTIHGLLRKRAELMDAIASQRNQVSASMNDLNALDRVLTTLGYDGERDLARPRNKVAMFVNAGEILHRLAGVKVQQGCASRKAPSRGPSCLRRVIPEGWHPSDCLPGCDVSGAWNGRACNCRRSSPGCGRGASGGRAARRSSARSRTRMSTRRTAGCW